MNAQCAICTHGLDLPGVPQPGINRETRICTIPCGHIFHYNCLNEWWRQLIYSTAMDEVVIFTCPVCRNVQDAPTVFRVFPSFSEAGTGTELRNENQVLRDTMRNQDVVIRRLRGNLFREQFKPCTHHKKRDIVRSHSAPP